MVLARSLVLGAAVLVSGTVAHVSAGGLLPSPLVMAGLLVWTVTAVASFALHRMRASVVVVVAVGGQTLVHTALSALAGHVGEVRAPGESVVLHELDHLTHQGPLMLLAHLLGSVALGLLLAHQERTLWRLVDVLATLLGPVRVLLPAPDRATARLRGLAGLADRLRRATRATGELLAPPRIEGLAPQLSRRGPPVLLAV